MLLPGLAISAFVLLMVGGEVMAAGYWGWGMMWGFATFIALGATFWLSRLSSPQWAMGTVTLFYLVLLIGTPMVYFDRAQDRFYRTVQTDKDERFPVEWEELGRKEVYRRWMADVLDQPRASGWWAHLRAQAEAGIYHAERAMEFQQGQPGYRPVYRQGGWLWLNWAASLFMAGVGCLFSLIGCAVWNPRVVEEESSRGFSEPVIDEVSDTLEEQGASEQEVPSVVYSSGKKDHVYKPIPIEKVAELLPELDSALVKVIRDDLEIGRQWRTRADPAPKLDSERLRLAEVIVRRHYPGRTGLIDPRHSGLLMLLAAHRLHETVPVQRFWYSLQRIDSVNRALGHQDRVKHFSRMDLSGLSFRRVLVGKHWESLVSRWPTFFEGDSCWHDLEQMAVEDIPEEAYLGILYQSCFSGDRRSYEGWVGTEPHEIWRSLGPRMRDALLTFIEIEAPSMGDDARVTSFAAFAAAWPFEIAAPIMERALQAGWHQSLAPIPESAEWYQILERYANSPFGSPQSSVRWYDSQKKRERYMRW